MPSSMLLGLPFFAAVAVAVSWFGRRAVSYDSFFAANRDIGRHSLGYLVAAISFPVCWTWANTLIIGPQKAYQDGLPSVIWFALLNALALVVFVLCSLQMRKVARDKIATLTGYIGRRFHRNMVWVFTVGICGISVYAAAGQFVGTMVLLEYSLGFGKDAVVALGPFEFGARTLLVLGLGVGMLSIAVMRGVESSFAADMVKALAIVVVLYAALLVFGRASGSELAAHLGGVKQRPPGLFDWDTLLRPFVIPLAISWISGGALDHQLYQRARSLSPEAARAPWWGIVPFGIVVFVISALGFFAPWETMKGLDPQLAGFVAISRWAPALGEVFVVAIAAALLATGASALNAAASSWAVDIVHPLRPQWSQVAVSRVVMLLVLALSIALALAGVTLLQMVLFIGAFRGALLFPTLLGLFSRKRAGASSAFAWQVGAAMAAGPLVAYWSGDPMWGGVSALAFSGIACLYEWRRNATA